MVKSDELAVSVDLELLLVLANIGTNTTDIKKYRMIVQNEKNANNGSSDLQKLEDIFGGGM